jgi:hypothetical protein
MPKSRRLRRTKRMRMRGGNEEELPTDLTREYSSEVPNTPTTISGNEQPKSLGQKAKEAMDAVKNWFGIGQEQTGGKSRKHRKSRKNHRKTRKH